MPLWNPTDSPGTWTNATLLNGWAGYGSSYPTAAYRRNSEGIVYFRGLITSANPIYGQAILQVPSGFRPGAPQMFSCISANNSTGALELGRLDIATNGQLIYYFGGGLYLSLFQIFYQALA